MYKPFRKCAVSLCLLLSIFLCACNTSAAAPDESTPGAVIGSGSESSTSAPAAPVEDDGTVMEIISSRNGITSSAFGCTPQGCYNMMENSSGSGNILYTDYATQSRVYLSTQMTGDHSGAQDTSYVESMLGGCFFAASSDNLFLFKLSTPASKNAYEPGHQGYIASYSFNGEDKKIITQFDPKEYLPDSCIAFDGVNLYYLRTLLDEEDYETETQLMRVNTQTGEQTAQATFEKESGRYYLVGSYGSRLIIKKIVSAKPITFDMPPEERAEIYRTQQQHILLLNAAGELTPVCDWTQGERSEIFYKDNERGDSMFYWDAQRKAIYKYDFGTQEETQLYAGRFTDAEGNEYTGISLFDDAYDGRILISAERTEGDENFSANFSYNLADGAVSQITVKYQGEMPYIYGEGEDYFLIQGQFVEFPGTVVVNGVTYPETFLRRALLLIRKEDFWANRSNFIPVKEYAYA